MKFCSENDFKNIYSDDNDFIRAGLGGMGYNHSRLYKKTIPSCKFIRGQFQTKFFKQ
jgi:hypothetical protein